MDAYWAAPPVSRTLTALTVVLSIAVYGGLLAAHRIIFYLPWIFKFPSPEIWRFFTPFFLTGPGLSILFDSYFLWTYSTALETSSPRFTRPGDFFVYMIFVGTFILLTAGFLLRGYIFCGALLLSFAYTFSQDNKTKKVSFFIIQIPAIYLPWVLLLATLVISGLNEVKNQATGILAAHLYDFLTRIYPTFGGGRNYIFTPYVVRRWFGGDKPNSGVRGYGTAYRPGDDDARRATASGFASWSGRGSGRRLGGD